MLQAVESHTKALRRGTWAAWAAVQGSWRRGEMGVVERMVPRQWLEKGDEYMKCPVIGEPGVVNTIWASF